VKSGLYALGSVLALAAVGAVASRRRGSRSASEPWDGIFVDLSTLEPRPRTRGDARGDILPRIPAWNSPELRAAFSRVREQRIEAGWPADHIPALVPGLEEEERYLRFLREAAFLGDPVRVFRMVSASRAEDVHLGEAGCPPPRYGRSGAGCYWSWDVKLANTYNSGDTHPEYLVVADVPATSVDWALTAQANVEWPEREITLRPGAPIRVLRVRDARRGAVIRQGPIEGRA